MFNAERTIYNIKIQNRMMCGLDYTPLEHTTLNEKFNIKPNEDYPSIRYPLLNILTIGCGDYTNNTSGNDRLNLKSSPHKPINSSLFNHVPFYLRPVSDFNNYPPSVKLRLHKKIFIGGVEYNAYYGYSISNFDSNDKILMYSNIESTYARISELDLKTVDILNPTPKYDVDLNNSNTYISDFIKVYTFLSLTEIIDIIYAFNILYPDEPKVITEIGVCTSKEDNSGTEVVNYMTQMAYLLDVKLDLNKALIKEKMEFYIELGGMSMLSL